MGNFQLGNILPARRGVPQIEVTFDIDANGIVNVKAKDLGTNKEQSITITSNTSLSDDEVEKMMREAEANKAEDEKRKEAAEAKNEADQVVFQAERSIEDLKDRISDSEKSELEDLIKKTKEAIEKNEIEDIKSSKDKLQEKLIAISSKIYEEAAKNAQAENSSENSDAKSEDNVKEANYEEK